MLLPRPRPPSLAFARASLAALAARAPHAPTAAASAPAPVRRAFVSSPAARAKKLPPRPKPPPDSDIDESFVKGSGPGGQKINKTSSAVQLRHLPTGIVVKSQATRSRSQNRAHARQLLARRLDDLLQGDQSRAAAVGHVKKKRADSAAKKSRRKYKKLSEDKASAAAAAAEPESGQGNREKDSMDPQHGTTAPTTEAHRRNQDKKP